MTYFVTNNHVPNSHDEKEASLARLPPIPPPYAGEDYYEDGEESATPVAITKNRTLSSWEQNEFLVDL